MASILNGFHFLRLKFTKNQTAILLFSLVRGKICLSGFDNLFWTTGLGQSNMKHGNSGQKAVDLYCVRLSTFRRSPWWGDKMSVFDTEYFGIIFVNFCYSFSHLWDTLTILAIQKIVKLTFPRKQKRRHLSPGLGQDIIKKIWFDYLLRLLLSKLTTVTKIRSKTAKDFLYYMLLEKKIFQSAERWACNFGSLNNLILIQLSFLFFSFC